MFPILAVLFFSFIIALAVAQAVSWRREEGEEEEWW